MMTPEELKEAKKKKGYTSRKLSELSGVPLGTIQKIMSGATSAPRLDTMNALERVLMRPDPAFSYSSSDCSSQPQILQDAPVPFERAADQSGVRPVRGSRAEAASDFSRMSAAVPLQNTSSENVLYECIGGKRFSLSDFGGVHQLLAAELYRQLSDALLADEPLSESTGSGRQTPLVCLSPFPLELPDNPGSVLLPDVFVTAGPIKIHSGRITGVPVFIAEIASPSTRKKDTSLKLETYVSAGVSEYWVIDPTDRSIMRCDIVHDNRIALFSFGNPVPVLTPSISCVVNTARFDEQIRAYTAHGVV